MFYLARKQVSLTYYVVMRSGDPLMGSGTGTVYRYLRVLYRFVLLSRAIVVDKALCSSSYELFFRMLFE